MTQKRILLIEDSKKHSDETKKILSDLSDKFTIIDKCFIFLRKNGDNRKKQKERIVKYIDEQIQEDTFDILMIDMLLGGDSPKDPLGFDVIKELFEKLRNKILIAYTEMSSADLDLIKLYNSNISNPIHIVTKPGNFKILNALSPCPEEHKKIIQEHENNCVNDSCNSKTRLLCAMKSIYYGLCKGEQV